MHNELSTKDGWRVDRTSPSLPESHRTILIAPGAGFWRKLLAFSGPGYLVAVGYMDPGNWATDLAGGSQFGYMLLSIILLSNLMAILLQSLCARLGIVTGRDLAQACRDHYSRPVSFGLWILCELAICACDLAEVIGSAIALNLLFKIPLVFGVCLTALDVLAVMYLQNKGFRYIEALVVTLILTIGGCFLVEIIFSHPSLPAVLAGLVPRAEVLQNPKMLFIAIGILGATVMPHNLYLHSSIVQTRKYEQTASGKAEAIKFATIDSTVALMFALFINAAILIVSAAICVGIYVEASTSRLIVISQVVLSLQLSFAVVPLVRFTSDRQKMGEFANRWWLNALAWITAALIAGLNAKYLSDTLGLTEAIRQRFQ